MVKSTSAGRAVARSEQLSNADIAVWQTYWLQRKLDSGESLDREDFRLVPRELLRPIRPMLAEGEWMVASGPCCMRTWEAPGDGTYTTTGVPTVLTGVANRQGTAMVAGAAAASIAMNALSKRKAKKDMQTRWMDFIPQGTMTVSTHGFYVEDYDHGLLRWSWDSLQSVEWRGPSTVELLISNESWTGRVLLQSDWAELLLVSWIHVAFPEHPGKYTWFTQDWVARVQQNMGPQALG